MRVSAIALGKAGRLERWAARAWNVLNEGCAFLPVFTAATVALWAGLGRERAPWPVAGAATGLVLLAAAALVRWDFPLHLRRWLWPPLAGAAALPGALPPPLGLWLLQLAAYGFFTVVVWGTLYYHLRIGIPLDNWRRFPRLVLETSDTTSGNAGEQVPKFLLLGWLWVGALRAAAAAPVQGPAAYLAFGAALWAYGWLIHRLGFTWRPAEPEADPPPPPRPAGRRRALVLVLDGWRLDLLERHAPFVREWLAGAIRYPAVEPVYPARTVTCFTSMLTGAYPRQHGVTRNLVWRRGIRCESLFEVLEREGRRGLLLAVAHLHDVFPRHCRPFTAVARNEEVDEAILAEARRVLEQEDPDLLVVQLIAVDQTGHSRGVGSPEHRARYEATDRALAAFWAWLERSGRLADTAVVICADHGQSRGIGSHGHLDEGERPVPFGIRVPGAGPRTVPVPATVASLAPTLACWLGVPAPRHARAPALPGPWAPEPPRPRGDVWVVIPAHDEAATVGDVVARVPRERLRAEGYGCRVLVVDDGSRDGTGERALAAGADLLLRLPARGGLGAAVRRGLAAAYRLGALAAVLLDADGEYPPEQIPDLLAPILGGWADVVHGSRFLVGRPPMRLSRRLGNRVFTALQVLLTGQPLTDGQTGMRAFGREALGDAEIAHDYNYAQVLTLNLLRKGYRLAEVPVGYRPRRTGTSFVRFPEYPLRVLPALWREWRRPLPPRGSRPAAGVRWWEGAELVGPAAASLDNPEGPAYNGGGR